MIHARRALSLFRSIDRSFSSKLLGTALAASMLATSCSKPEAQASGPPPVPVKVQKLSSENVLDSSEYVGNLEASQRVTLQPQIEGRIQEVYVKSGDRVQAGTPILSLSVDQTEANVASAQAAVNANVAALRTQEATLQASQADLVKAQADLKLKQVNYERARQLTAEGAYSQAQLDSASNDLAASQANVDAASKQVAAARAAVNQAEATVRQAQANVASNSVNLKFKQVTSPIAGVVGDFPVKVGDYMTPSSTLTTITQNDLIDMRIAVPSSRSGQLRQGLPVELIDPASKKAIARGSVAFISPTVNVTEQSVLIKARFPNQDGKLRDQQYVQARIIWNSKPGVLIPTTAISRIGGTTFVFVSSEGKAPDGKPQQVAQQRQVKLGDIQGENYQVLEGLKPGESIVTTNILKLRDGAPIQPGS